MAPSKNRPYFLFIIESPIHCNKASQTEVLGTDIQPCTFLLHLLQCDEVIGQKECNIAADLIVYLPSYFDHLDDQFRKPDVSKGPIIR